MRQACVFYHIKINTFMRPVSVLVSIEINCDSKKRGGDVHELQY